MRAARAYEDIDTRGRISGRPTVFVSEDGVNNQQKADQWMARWRYIGGEMGPICAAMADKSCSFITGLQYQMWARRDCGEVAIAFRGTDRGSLGDWLSNFHGVMRVLKLPDQYEQVQWAIDRIVRMARSVCGKSAAIVTVGHSLGGGLAQQAAYMTNDIRRVYAFDPSFITGWYDEHTRRLVKGLTIDRVYEHGEILAYARFVIRRLVPETVCDPLVRGFRVDLIHGQPIFQHSMEELASEFIRVSGTPYSVKSRQPLPKPVLSKYPECAPGQPPKMVAGR